MATGKINKCVPSGYFQTLAVDTDFDSITQNGFYYVQTATNAPTANKTHYNVWVQRFGTNENYLHQIAVSINGQMYFRIRNGAYSSWKTIPAT